MRGESYCDDNKKVSPGPAMSKLLLLELYEVEPKVSYPILNRESVANLDSSSPSFLLEMWLSGISYTRLV